MTIETITKLEKEVRELKGTIKKLKRDFLETHALYAIGEHVWSPIGERVYVIQRGLNILDEEQWEITYRLGKVNSSLKNLKKVANNGYYVSENRLTKI